MGDVTVPEISSIANSEAVNSIPEKSTGEWRPLQESRDEGCLQFRRLEDGVQGLDGGIQHGLDSRPNLGPHLGCQQFLKGPESVLLLFHGHPARRPHVEQVEQR